MTRGPLLCQKRYQPSASSLGDKVFVYGGNYDEEILGSVEILDTKRDPQAKWELIKFPHA